MSKVSLKVLAVVFFVIAPIFLYASSSVSGGVDTKYTPSVKKVLQKKLFDAVNNNDVKSAKKLLQEGVNPNYLDPATQLTPLIKAVQNSSNTMVTLLLAYKANPNQIGLNRRTALHYVFLNKLLGSQSIDNMQLLLQAGANGTLKDANGRTVRDYFNDYKLKSLDLDSIEKIEKILSQYGISGPLHTSGSSKDLEMMSYKEDIKSAMLNSDSFATRNLLFFIHDETVYFSDAVYLEFMSAIAQEVGPILVPSTMFNNLFFNQFLLGSLLLRGLTPKDPYSVVIKQYLDLKKQLSKLDAADPKRSILLRSMNDIINNPNKTPQYDMSFLLLNMPFNPLNWMVWEVPGNYMLLIPRQLMEQYTNEAKALNITVDSSVGLYISSLTPVSSAIFDYFIKAREGKQVKASLLPVKKSVSKELSDVLKALIIPKSLYDIKGKKDINESFISAPRWLFYITGHGSVDGTFVSGMKMKSLQKVLLFCQEQIITRLLVLSTCYGAGTNMDALLNDSEKKLNGHNFPLITCAITDAVVSSFNPRSFVILDHIKILWPVYFKPFINYFTHITYPHFADGIESIMSNKMYIKKGLISLAGDRWFSLLDADKVYIPIQKNLAKTTMKEINVNKYFNVSSPKALLLYTHHVPYTLVVNDTVQFIPMKFGTYYIDSLMIKNGTLKNWYDALLLFRDFELMDLYIKQCTVGNDIAHYVYVFCDKENTSVCVFWTDNNNGRHVVNITTDKQVDRLLDPHNTNDVMYLTLYQEKLLKFQDVFTQKFAEWYHQKDEVNAIEKVLEKKLSDVKTKGIKAKL